MLIMITVEHHHCMFMWQAAMPKGKAQPQLQGYMPMPSSLETQETFPEGHNLSATAQNHKPDQVARLLWSPCVAI
jgi:hypothetical protein